MINIRITVHYDTVIGRTTETKNLFLFYPDRIKKINVQREGYQLHLYKI